VNNTPFVCDMYQTDFYRCNDHEKIGFFLRNCPFAVITHDGKASGHFAYLPLIVENWTTARQVLFGHIDNDNPFLTHLEAGTGAVHAVFLGPNEYVSPIDYISKQLPTWNYSVVHVSGVISLVTDEVQKMSEMEEMVNSLEPKHSFKLDRSDENIKYLMTKITFFIIEVTNIEAVFKYSQDKPREDMLAAKSSLLRKLDDKNRCVLSRLVE
jgi:transcriptional regulator